MVSGSDLINDGRLEEWKHGRLEKRSTPIHPSILPYLPSIQLSILPSTLMNALILAAGYATRLYPLTLNKAKPLLEVAGKPIIERIADQLTGIPGLETVYVVTNHKFAAHFSTWAASYRLKRESPELTVINDGTTSDADKRGAIGDIHFVLNMKNIFESDLLVVAGDNLFSEPLIEFAEFSAQRSAALGVYDVKSLDRARNYNQLMTNSVGILTSFEEKIPNPTSTICGIALYYYGVEALRLLDLYIRDGNNPDQPGRFVQWLYKRLDVFTFPIGGLWYDIGSRETLEEANVLFSNL
jgi:glucose-1-phosphate thymidylyltransferase